MGGIEAPRGLEGGRLESFLGPAMRRRLEAFARRFVEDETEAEDIAQEVLLRAGLDPSGLLAAERADSWLLRVCRHVAIDHVRARRVRQAVWAPMPDESDCLIEGRHATGRVSADWRRFKLRRRAPPEARGARVSLRDLPAQSRLLMSLYYEKGYSQPTICRMTGLSASALRVRLFRARGSLVARALRA
ncbi:MAG TPA: sigma-70 family RNA polymerase sigma factor [Planctomycetota bacterium]|nr:sigma-70 family RNA polymerase sigma factor [Planctomycetota bacterium]